MHFLRSLVLATLFTAGLAACSRPASVAPVVYATPTAPRIIVERLQVNEGSGIYLAGRSSLPDGECIQTELLAGGKAATWWPHDVCVEVASGRWEMLAALGQNGAPQQLEPDVEYEIHAWWSEQPEQVDTRFPFDLTFPGQTP